ncbi:hypothetical protein M2162_001302 [Streptomyces sp. SAI-041]|nr:hypothetical protein [Streptomyces sp. SAI-041]
MNTDDGTATAHGFPRVRRAHLRLIATRDR